MLTMEESDKICCIRSGGSKLRALLEAGAKYHLIFDNIENYAILEEMTREEAVHYLRNIDDTNPKVKFRIASNNTAGTFPFGEDILEVSRLGKASLEDVVMCIFGIYTVVFVTFMEGGIRFSEACDHAVTLADAASLCPYGQPTIDEQKKILELVRKPTESERFLRL